MSEFQDYNRKLIEDFRAAREKGEQPLGGSPVLLLTTTGAKSGKSHTTPVRAFFDGDQPFVIGSKGGAPSHPDWYRNLVKHPEVSVELGKDMFKAQAVVTTGEERERLWKQATTTEPGFAEYQTKTTRQIPVIKLERSKA
ncbi:MAG TPA: nitroreductase family deazaflavin-dependent oxidoreductase [Aggregatilineales bacterium]|nr:nitroreductase family deazaflavin-dependent oxidoreductase [Aggregatilineales bacterium]